MCKIPERIYYKVRNKFTDCDTQSNDAVMCNQYRRMEVHSHDGHTRSRFACRYGPRCTHASRGHHGRTDHKNRTMNVANNLINGKQCKILWHLDDSKISPVEAKEVEGIRNKLNKNLEKKVN